MAPTGSSGMRASAALAQPAALNFSWESSLAEALPATRRASGRMPSLASAEPAHAEVEKQRGVALATAGLPAELEMLFAAVGSSAARHALGMLLSASVVLDSGMYAEESVGPQSWVTASAMAAVGGGVKGVNLLSAFSA
mmetsp:Transcript_5677/g.9545  ORF Transcript_5677/g.9545 Transcript_5677/m.9545 type:complete len:139 (-) Transcript_5677:534-950(-)